MRWLEPVEPLSPRQVVDSGLCIGCGGCMAGARAATMTLDAYGQYRPAGDPDFLAGSSEAFARTCPFSPSARDEDRISAARFPFAPHHDGYIGRFEAAYVGHVEEGDFRRVGSSGGMVSWTAAELLRTGLVDGIVHVGPTGAGGADMPYFAYRISRTEAEVRHGAKSRYHPVELSGVIDQMRAEPGRYAVVGVPCFIKAIHLLCAQDPVLGERVAFTLGLVCGHMKSARLAESFAWQMGAGIDQVRAIDFRAKDPNRPANWYTAEIVLADGDARRLDWWRMVDGDWGAGFFQNSACDACDDVVAETADASFGDAWIEPYSSDGRGTNIVIVRSPVLHRLVREAVDAGRLKLNDVDAEFIHQTQAAGFRQRREGLALRLSRRRKGLVPNKRVGPSPPDISWRRRQVYLMRSHIAASSHRVFRLARRHRRPWIYTRWAQAVLAIYQALAYSRGRLGAALDRLGL